MWSRVPGFAAKYWLLFVTNTGDRHLWVNGAGQTVCEQPYDNVHHGGQLDHASRQGQPRCPPWWTFPSRKMHARALVQEESVAEIVGSATNTMKIAKRTHRSKHGFGLQERDSLPTA